MTDDLVNPLDDTYLLSNFFEQLVEHAFVSEILQEVYYGRGEVVEVLRSEVDSSGYDLILECNGVMRHVQLKTSRPGARAASQKVHLKLGEKPGGCVIWVIRHECPESRRMRLSYRFFGGAAGERLPSLAEYKIAKHNKGDSTGKKKERSAIRVIPKSQFRVIETTSDLVDVLFGPRVGDGG
jgi:hypothetical protein